MSHSLAGQRSDDVSAVIVENGAEIKPTPARCPAAVCLQAARRGVDPKTVRRDRPPYNADVREAMKEIAGKRRRFGYRRIGVLLERKGYAMNHKKLYRLYREEGLAVKR